MPITQSDFATLVAEYQHDESWSPNVTKKAISDLAATEDKIPQAYVPVNFIPPEAYALIAAWEASNSTTAGLADHMDIEYASAPVAQDIDNDLAPPKRFSRTFWRSVSRRILASNTEM